MLLTSNYKQVCEQLKVDVMTEGKEGQKMFLGGIKIIYIPVIKKIYCQAAQVVHCQCINRSEVGFSQ